MTRINCIPVTELTNKHLVAEYRELPRVFKLAKPVNDAPEVYVLGAGHMKFFYNKLDYLYKRQWQLYNEMKARGFNPSFIPETLYTEFRSETNLCLWQDWKPTAEAMAINRKRISERLREAK